MKTTLSTLAAALFCVSASLAHAQAPADAGKGPGAGPGQHRMMMKPCSQEADPAKCEADRKQRRESFKSAQDACKDKPDRRGCMTEQYCSKQSDPAKCKERAGKMHEHRAKHMDDRQAMAEACTGKRGDDLQKCYREQHDKKKAAGGTHDHGAPAKK